ncbi:hypothetical protein NW767_015081 [Fusarium falciforme]|nr:hypothetical protein NW767_015081 [Fusarium falciforme]
MLPKLGLTLSALAACGAEAGIIVEPKKYYKHKCDPVSLVENPSFNDEGSSGNVDESSWVLPALLRSVSRTTLPSLLGLEMPCPRDLGRPVTRQYPPLIPQNARQAPDEFT